MNKKTTSTESTTKANDAKDEEFDLLALLLQQYDQEGRDATHPSLPVDSFVPESASDSPSSFPLETSETNTLSSEQPNGMVAEEPGSVAAPASEEAPEEAYEEEYKEAPEEEIDSSIYDHTGASHTPNVSEQGKFNLLSLLLQQYDQGQDGSSLSGSSPFENAPHIATRTDFDLEEYSPVLSPVERGESDPRTEMEQLQALLLTRERRHIRELEREIMQLRLRLNDHDALVEILSPIIGHAIADRVRDSQEEVAEALYPVIGKTISRAVTEAIRDLARSIDNTMRQNFHPKAFKRLMWRFRGLNPDEASLREMLPFQVKEIFLIHRDSGLLIHHLSNTATMTDADLISGMLTAIRSYVAESFGEGKEGSLDDISYGDLRILIQEGSLAILAVVLQGIEPSGFQHRMREQLSIIHNEFRTAFRTFEGDALDEERLNLSVRPLMETNDAAT